MNGQLERIAILLGAVTLLAGALLHASDEYPALQHNPFDRPVTEAPRNYSAPASSRTAVGDAPFLRGVLVAGPKSVVNFGGVILKIGESTNGYRLLSVTEGSASFSKDGEKVVFSLHEPEQADEQ